MKKKELTLITEIESRLRDLELPPCERLKKGFELSQWAMKLNKFNAEEIENRLKGYFVLR